MSSEATKVPMCRVTAISSPSTPIGAKRFSPIFGNISSAMPSTPFTLRSKLDQTMALYENPAG